MIRPLLSTLLLALASAPLLAADFALPAPERLALHPDGARVQYRLAVPAGTHRVLLPDGVGAAPTVLGAAAWRSERVAAPPPTEPPAALAALLPERDRLAALDRELAARAAMLTAAQGELERALAQGARAGLVDAATWQAPLDALLDGRAALDRDRLAADAAREALVAKAEALVPQAAAAGEVLALGDGAPLRLDPAALSRRWRGLATAPTGTALVVTVAQAGEVTVVDERTDLSWQPSVAIAVAGGKATLVRRCTVRKPVGFALPPVAAIAFTEPLRADLRAPEPSPVALRVEEVAKAERGSVATGSVESGWNYDAAPESANDAERRSVAVPEATLADTITDEPRIVGADVSTRPTDTPTAPGPSARANVAQALPIGSLELPSGTSAVTVDADRADVAVISDEWAVVPELSPVAIRRIDVRTDRPLPPGTLALTVDGVPAGQTSLDEQPAGAVLHLRAGEDDRVYVGTDVAWEVDPATQRRDVQRHGRDRWIWNLGTEPRRLPVYVAMPVSRSAELTVTLDGATTPGSTSPEPGILRWEVELPPGTCTRVGAGWVIEASGRLKL